MPAKHCTVCGVEYVPGSAISKYCPICAKKVQREKSNECKRRSREQKRMACIELSAKNDRLMAVSEQEAREYDDKLEKLEKKHLPSQEEFYIMSRSFLE